MKKRILSALLVIAMILSMGMLAGCGSSGTSSGTGNVNFTVPEAGFDMNTEVTITFEHTMGQKLQGVLDYYIEEFEKLYPNIHVEHSNVGGWSDISGTISTEIFGGTQPNIAYCYPDHVALYNLSKSVVTLDSLIDSTSAITLGDGTSSVLGLTAEQKADFIEGYYNEGKVYGDGLMYTMPLNKSTEVLYYNKTFFQEHKLKVPTTWDELWDVCDKILAIDPTCYPLGYDAEDNWFITLCEQMGSGYTSATGDHYLFDNETNRAFVKKLRECYQKGYFTTQELYGGYTSGLFVEQTDTRSYMCIGSSGGASYQMSNQDTEDGSFAFEVGVAPIPQYNSANQKTISQGPSLCILKGADTTDQEIMASWLFVKFLCTNIDFQASFSMTSGYMPVLKSVTKNETYAAWLAKANGYENLVATCVQIGIDGRDNYFVSPAFNGSTTARTQVGSLLVKCLSSEITGDVDTFIKNAFSDAIEECEFQTG